MNVVHVLLAVTIATASAGMAAFTLPYHKQDVAVVHPKDDPGQVKTEQGNLNNTSSGCSTHEGKMPYIVGLSFRKDDDGWWCEGSIIANNWILTAAHCTHESNFVKVFYGALQRLNGQPILLIGPNNYIQHPAYNPVAITNDVALIRTKWVDFNHMINRIELPALNNRKDINYINWWAVGTGWGRTDYSKPVSNTLNCANLKIISNFDCRSDFSAYVTEHTICTAHTDMNSTCTIDSGSPLVTFDGRLIGIASFATAGGCAAGPTGYTLVTGYLDWIREHTDVAY